MTSRLVREMQARGEGETVGGVKMSRAVFKEGTTFLLLVLTYARVANIQPHSSGFHGPS